MASAKSLTTISVKQLLELTASPLPTPGGGCAAALAGALAAALVEKIARKSERRTNKAKAVTRKAAGLRARLTAAIPADAKAYWKVVQAFRAQNRRRALKTLVAATSIPRQVVEDARAVARLIKAVKPMSASVWRSDLQCAWLLAEAAQGAGLALVIANQQFMERWSKRQG